MQASAAIQNTMTRPEGLHSNNVRVTLLTQIVLDSDDSAEQWDYLVVILQVATLASGITLKTC